ncbi:MAG: cupin domain-containing protein [Pseudohongiellaceae bacterium]
MSLRPGVSIGQVDNARVRVTQWRLPPGTETGHHRHEYDYVIVPVIDGVLTIADSDGTKKFPLQAGQSYFRPKGVEHNVMNVETTQIAFVEVEIK